MGFDVEIDGIAFGGERIRTLGAGSTSLDSITAGTPISVGTSLFSHTL